MNKEKIIKIDSTAVLLCGLQIAEMLAGVTLVASGLSLMIKSGLGQTAITSCTQDLAVITGLKGGTLVAWLHVLSVFFQIVLQGKTFQKLQLLQFFIAWLQGQIVNLICYDLPGISAWLPQSYAARWACMLAAIGLTAYGVAMTMAAELIRLPFEQFAYVLAQRLGMRFSVLRTRIDMGALALSLVMVILFRLDLTTLREGTWVSMLLLGRCMGACLPVAKKLSLYQRALTRTACGGGCEPAAQRKEQRA